MATVLLPVAKARWLPRWGRAPASPSALVATAEVRKVASPAMRIPGQMSPKVEREEDEPFVPEEEEPAAEWRNGQTQGDHLMLAKANRQSRISQAVSSEGDDEWR